MSFLAFCLLSSGSRANSIFIECGEKRILVDCGLTGPELNRRMRERGLDPESITDIIVSHEHRDHIHGVCTVAKKFGATVHVNKKTSSAWREFCRNPPAGRRIFQTGECFPLGALEITSFGISHDAADPVGFRIRSPFGTIGIATDLGHVTTIVRESLRGLDALILESNHDPLLLESSPYPRILKDRIASRRGHLSNHSAAALLEELFAEPESNLRTVVGAHISENSNDPSLVRDTLQPACERSRRSCSLHTASMRAPTEIFRVETLTPEVTSSGSSAIG